jgi:hypothetical protein
MFKHSIRITILASSLSLSAPALAQRGVTPPASAAAPPIANPCPLEHLYEVGAMPYVAVLNELAQLNEICLRLKVLADEGAIPRIELFNAVTRYSETLRQLGQTTDATVDSACRAIVLK